MTLNEYIDSIKHKRICVIGIGVSNTPLIKKLLASGCDVTACDKRTAEQLGQEHDGAFKSRREVLPRRGLS